MQARKLRPLANVNSAGVFPGFKLSQGLMQTDTHLPEWVTEWRRSAAFCMVLACSSLLLAALLTAIFLHQGIHLSPGPPSGNQGSWQHGSDGTVMEGKPAGQSSSSSTPEASPASNAGTPALYTYRVKRAFPHDPEAFTQGLLYYGDNTLYESTGLHGRSSVREVDLLSGKVLKQFVNSATVFGEGLALFEDRLLQLSWQNTNLVAFNRDTIAEAGRFRHGMKDGWGLTNNASILMGTDGSDTLYFLDPKTFQVRDRVQVTDGGRNVNLLNEVEYIDEEVWANVWQTECIARISPSTGAVTSWVLMDGLRSKAAAASTNEKAIDVLNGIAWDAEKKRLFVTGKLWSKIYQVTLQPIEVVTPEMLEVVRARCIP
eukprot:TRINITY_DN3709_c0_g1_i1.p1 TRINITY_DN3709_c0_g1~~TRINITY_DN3709_c0_g1_i1.p1  ORF type:complete len:373 (+),score=54.40 TRINITY_DN3709_c0_g1_i1:329-1447(+)